MAYDDDDDDLFAEEFDFVDDDDSDILDSDLETAEADDVAPAKKPAKSRGTAKKAPEKTAGGGQRSAKSKSRSKSDSADSESTADEPAAQQPAAEPEGPPPPPTDHVVHLYEFGSFRRTIQREFTEQDAVAFAEEFNRTSKPYNRAAIAASKDDEPDETL